MTHFSVAGVQMPVSVSGNNIPAMLQRASKIVHVHPWTDMILFSELAPHGPSIGFATEDAESIEAPFREFAAKHRVWLCPGSYFVKRGEDVFNHTVVINPEGEIVGEYDKMFPFRPYEHGVKAGENFLIFDVPDVGRFGLSICYDIWFPETTRTLVSQGVEVLLHPVLTGTTDRDAELAIARATAVMFQCYVVDVNGLDAGGIGRSVVADPTGRILHDAGQADSVFPLELDLALVKRCRKRGANGLGQTLKSYRDKSIDFDIYKPGPTTTYLRGLGPLQMPLRDLYPC
ncbi:carbon-nitrogen hydrolase family protein [Ruegeria sediminis]|uniref:Carbon-nitrogen hydrolase family protein n=1 Tax=Ruegeria sediminis TaxID=2583820 RepID=A0ABY2WY40_9RHOB|nr:carbon-nitrogen hydrolase family protein [Ruegeria sediminis]TMV07784.1 carbon-nitrogen hydrolase family protein [Ruegeria sediminis]